MNLVRKEWASAGAVRSEVADVPGNWLKGFAVKHPLDCRKFAATRNGSMLYRVPAVLKAIEEGEAMPNLGIVERGEAVTELLDELGVKLPENAEVVS